MPSRSRDQGALSDEPLADIHESGTFFLVTDSFGVLCRLVLEDARMRGNTTTLREHVAETGGANTSIITSVTARRLKPK